MKVKNCLKVGSNIRFWPKLSQEKRLRSTMAGPQVRSAISNAIAAHHLALVISARRRFMTRHGEGTCTAPVGLRS